ncbi:MAG: hypothetical protein COT18_04425 [Elusimicrobia bacterium CG08_land_8_20_14_0_20_59_10]|nr:MAG: hypothetical protein COT18_04425 [Elusimicrobia bacterium CG08_land_8_20_14_0_20_59_10]
MPSETELAVAGFYDGIYLFYGPANSLLTLGLDRFWRTAAARAALEAAPGARSALDICCGTGDFLAALRAAYGPGLKLAGADLSAPMLSLAEKKGTGAALVRAEARKLPFPGGTFDLAAISFAARNLNTTRENLVEALKECRRVLKPGGVFINLETTRPASPLLRLPMDAYVRTVTGLLNLLHPASRAQYSFLRNTILNFHTAPEFSALLTEAGFTSPSYKTLFPGAVAVHTARA